MLMSKHNEYNYFLLKEKNWEVFYTVKLIIDVQ